ncbi:hypothetical protein ACH4NS_34275 [Streptomyces mutabilis]|uniref:hypothetical protein n=1 Tax=Streptomyces mutabilis TaxID=67332 RepID=UPI000A234DAE|nr:hypothetical protein [Streptomyces sp. Alain-F2R5]MDG9690289.1 hypothetical protein [Streptomyces sp. DH17]OSC61096.1 hypothetical protein B5181_28795 [Streptomyces sp. 4F]PAN00423.1 hypothetical protein CJI59_17145 [Streptomyces sp. Alain-F2R5]
MLTAFGPAQTIPDDRDRHRPGRRGTAGEAPRHPAGKCGHINSAGALDAWQHGRVLLDSLTPR